MRIEQLKLINFKSHSVASYRFKASLNCFIGLNGAGKTNILDAIYYASVTKSRFNNADTQLIHYGESFFRIEAIFDHHLPIVVKYQKGRKIVENDGVVLDKLSEHFGRIPVVMACPDDVLMMIGGSEERRKFIDYTLSSIDSTYLKDLLQYNHFLFQKNALLKSNSRGGIDLELMRFYNSKLCENGLYLYEKRKKSIELLANFIDTFYGQIAVDKEKIVLQYDSEVDPSNFAKQLEDSLEKEMATQRTCIGIHRDDILFLTNERTTKKFASQGQQKTYLYALKLAQYRMIHQSKQEKPILMIDDVFDKLDEERSKALLTVLSNKEWFDQIFLTDTDKEKLKRLMIHQDYEIFEL